MASKCFVDFIKTIEEDEDIVNFSGESEPETEFQPSKQKSKKRKEFDVNFKFASSVEEYNKDSWCDLKRYVKRKASTKTDDKIKVARRMLNNENDEDLISAQEVIDGNNSDMELSDDEMVFDNIKTKTKKKSKKDIMEENGTETKDDFFEDVDVPQENCTFYEMNLSRPLMKSISNMKFVHPTPIQAATIPVALLGRDICGCAATGTGKTAAYMLPTLERLLYRSASAASTRVLVLVPTRELGVQVYQVTRQLAQNSDIDVGLAVGGLDLKAQEAVLRKNPDIVIATPGRLLDHLQSTPSFNLSSIEVLILDEADRMLDEYFAEQMKQIIKQCARTRQTMLFSATMSEEVRDLAIVSLNKPVRIFVDSNKEVAFNLRQEFVRIRKDKEADRETILAALVCRTFREHTIIFVQTKKQAHRLHVLLGMCGVKVAELHGNLTQPQRLEALQKFRDALVDVLVATDVAARGLDIPSVKTVVNFVMPATLEHYIHRVGRTARAGRAGVSVSLAGEQERKIVKEIIKRAANPVKSRVIPNDILEKYKVKLSNLEPQVLQILQEEYEERALDKTEKQMNRAKSLLSGKIAPDKRPWFQSAKERLQEKERLALKPKDPVAGKGSSNKQQSQNGQKRRHRDTPEHNVRSEMNKVALLQARFAKRKLKPKRINAVADDATTGQSHTAKRKKSNFSDELTDVSKSGAKKFRHATNVHKRASNQKVKPGGGGKKPPKSGGKAFGRPTPKKQR